MKGRHQWRPLAAGGHIPAPEVSDSGNAGFFNDQVRVTDLH